ncbi:hypothetical protein MNBD_GAMMA06-2034 [hydrothermal vent metagenome]|uniref:Uncharacterized protein n=1 Tax=hydrothermal vent metagenome TaxID=652676 RepID=A0A3B0WJP7_9ZZZZ
MSDTSQREWQFYLEDMLKFTRNVLSYTEELAQTVFVESGIT